MTKTSIALTELVEKGADQDFLRDLVTHGVDRLMALSSMLPYLLLSSANEAR